MRIKGKLKFISLLVATITLSCVACNSVKAKPTPKYLIEGPKVATVGNFDYYAINSNTEYAVALKESARSLTGTIAIDSYYDGKPVTGIYRYGFANSRATTVTIPSTVTIIDYEAFMDSKITSVTIPASITAIGESAFYSCKSLTKVSIQNTTTASSASSACSCDSVEEEEEGEEERVHCTLTKIPSFCFFNCNNLKELVLPQSIEEIEYEAFNGCRSLYTTIAFMNIKAIRTRAFQGCAALKNIYISSTFFEKDPETNLPIGIIEEKAFEDCNSSLKFYLVGNEDDVQDWLDLHSDNKWRWKNETTNPAVSSNLYTYEITASGASYTNDWIYTTVNGEVEITSYIGPTEIDGVPVKFLSFPNDLPNGSGNYVRKIAVTALNTVKANLERIYLPKKLKRIEANMFNADYDKLIVVDDNTKCSLDEEAGDVTARIILNGLTELEVIGNNAFVNMDKLATMKKLYLPYSLKAVGISAFGTSGDNNKHMKLVTDFRWDYDDEKSALKVIGKEAFYELGRNSNSKDFKTPAHIGYLKNNGDTNYQLTTLIIPRTFEHFGISSNENNLYTLGGTESDDASFGKSAFAGCPLLSKVVFKGSKKNVVQAGSNSDNNVSNLIIGTQTFAMNESLRTIVFEERCGKSILFHTAGGTTQPAVGWSAGRAKNDFGGDPAIQTIVLPNKYTTIRMQNFAMHGNSRGAVYFSSGANSKIYGSTTAKMTSSISNIASNQVSIGNVKQWCLIGDEGFYNGGYQGYCFAGNAANQSTDKQNRYGLDQSMPIYENVLYQETITAPGIDNVEVFVGLGSTNSANEYVEKDKCAFVCGATTATMSKYLYDRYRTTDTFNGTATVPATVKRSNGTDCTVTAIGPSAFSAAYCDTTSYKSDNLHKDLSAVLIPDTIQTIGDYAFMRAYGITKVSAYKVSTGVSNGDYIMPSSLTTIGKQAFAFCNIKQFLNIPDTCRFYENLNATTYETSVFSNNFSLRKITFGSNSTSSTYYTTTTYSHNGGGTYTSAIYSKNTVAYNASSLLLVLYRDSGADRLAASSDCENVNSNSVFDGQYADHYLYGAFKMCYWIDSLVVGTSIDDSKNQPLISGIYNVSGNKDNIIYLNNAYDFTGTTCNLKEISFGEATTIATPPYSFEGCEQLVKIKLPRVEGGHLPAGLFAFIDNEDIVFNVPKNDAGTVYEDCAEGILDLTYTGYTCIDSEAFKGTSITKVIAPKTANFTIEEDAFANCASLTEFDFTNVTTSVTINQNAFGNCTSLTSMNFSTVSTRVTFNGAFKGATIPNGLFNFGSSALIEFGDETFKGSTFPSESFSFPAKTAIIGNSCFEGCSTLKTVTADAVLTNLERVVVDNGSGKNNEGNDTGFKQIGNYAFYKCTNLNNFDFTKFSQIERIGHYAFSMANEKDGVIQAESGNTDHKAIICTNGIVDLPASITNLGVGAFNSSKVKVVNINSSSIKFERGKKYTTDTRASWNNGGHTFRKCSELTKIFFSNPDCSWETIYLLKKPDDGQDNYFSGCPKLTEIYFPTGYDLQYYKYTGTTDTTRPDSMVWDSNTSLKFYVYHTVYDLVASPAISDFWHRMSGGSTAPIVFYVGSNADVITGTAGSYSEKRSGTVYWTIYNGTPVYLGTASVNAASGLVTFQTSGYTADSTGVLHS